MATACNDKIMHQQELTSEDKRYAAAILNENDENRKNAIAEIRRWIEENDNLCKQIDDYTILRFLRVCKFNLEKTKSRIQNYYKQQFELSEWYMNKDPLLPELQELLKLGVFLPLRQPDNKGRLIFLIRGTRHDPQKHKISDIFKIGLMMVELAVKNYTAASIYGCLVFIDVANPTMRHALQMRPQIIMNLANTWQNCYPIRIQLISMYNAPKYVDVVVNVFKSFMSDKMKKRFYIYAQGMTQNCFKDISPDILPVEYGGTNYTFQELIEYWKKLVEENRNWFLENEKVDNSN